MAVTVDSFKTRFPEFSCTDDDRVTLIISEAQDFIGSATKWGSLYDQAVNFMTAHKLAVANQAAESDNGKGTGQLVSLNVQDQYTKTYSDSSRQGSQDSSADSDLGLTIYGQQYSSLKRRVIGAYQISIV